MQSESFIDDRFEVRKSLDDFRRCNWVVFVSESFVEFGLEFRLSLGVQGEVVRDGAGGTGMPGQRTTERGRSIGQSHLEVVSEPAMS